MLSYLKYFIFNMSVKHIYKIGQDNNRRQFMKRKRKKREYDACFHEDLKLKYYSKI